MKRIAIIVVTLMMTLTASAHSIRYFTFPQAQRTVQYLNAQQEMMIYCGYEYELETYVLINEVWMERVNSSYYELWVYGYDAYTGDEIYMPLDLQCVWLYSAGRMYNAAQYLRFHATVRPPSFSWYVPAYHPYTRRVHMVGYVRSYHYDIHRHGWMPPAPPVHGYGPHTQPPLPPYYMRTPQTPAPAPMATWTPGIDRPQISNTSRSGSSSIPTTRQSTGGTQTPSATPSRNSGAARSGSTGTTTTTRSSTGTTPTRSNAGTQSSTARSSEGTGTTRSSSGTSTSTSRSSSTTSSSSRSSSAATPTTRSSSTSSTSRSSNTATPTTRSSSTSSTSRSSSTASPTTRSSSTSSNSRSSNSGTATRSTSTTTRR